jgi:hypothetical protein
MFAWFTRKILEEDWQWQGNFFYKNGINFKNYNSTMEVILGFKIIIVHVGK